jgi:hypothetical protein
MPEMQPQRVQLQTKDERAPYRTPKLVRYGMVASLTKSGSSDDVVEDPTYFPSSQAG